MKFAAFTHPHPDPPLVPARGIPDENGSKAARTIVKGEGENQFLPLQGGERSEGASRWGMG